jgi:hypothetical protein
MAAYAEVQNVKVSGDLTMKGIARGNMTLKDNEAPADSFGESISAILSQVRLRVDADLTDNVSTTLRLLNERIWGEETTSNAATDSGRTGIDLDLAYVTLKEFLYSPLTLVIGRQELRYGNALIIGDPDTNGIAAGHGITAAGGTILPRSLDDLSCRKAFDAIKAVLNFDPLIVDLFYSKVDENNVKTADDVDLYGLNASYALNKTTSLEGYFFQRTRDAWNLAGTGQIISKPEKTRVLGAKGVYTGIANMILSLEGAYQFGNHITSAVLYPDDNVITPAPGSRKLNAFAIQTGAMYMMPKVKYTPTIGGNYGYLSGDKYLSVNKTSHGWNPMFEDQSGGTLFNKILGFSNCQLFNLNGSLRPMEDVKLALDYYYLRLVNPYTSLATAVTLSGVSGDPTYAMKGGKKSLGSEVDLNLTYDYTEDVQFGLSSGAFIPAGAFDKANKRTASQVIGSMKVTF